MRGIKLLTAVLCVTLFTSCSARLLDFTVISSKNVDMSVPQEAKGERATGKSIKFLGIGANIKQAVDNSIEKGGSQYDALIDGVIRYKSYVFAEGYECEGTPINTTKLEAYMGEEKFEKWAQKHDIRYKSDQEEDEADS